MTLSSLWSRLGHDGLGNELKRRKATLDLDDKLLISHTCEPTSGLMRAVRVMSPRRCANRIGFGMLGTMIKTDEIKYYGLNACLALWHNRANDIIRVYVGEERVKELGPLLKWCARQKKAYHVLGPDELAKVAASTHHEGVIILGRIPRLLYDDGLLERAQRAPQRDMMILLDGVQNPHNIGALLRTAAHLGASAVIGARATLPVLTPSAMRISEGGMEHVAMVALDQPAATVRSLGKLGYQLLGTSGSQGESLYLTSLPARFIVALGNEIEGLSPKVASHCQAMLRIPGTGSVESLNVGIAGALTLGEWWRQHQICRP